MIDFLILSEFDNNEGSVVRLEYPSKTGISETVLSSYMIPEGAHNIRNDTFCFVVSRMKSEKNNGNLAGYFGAEIKEMIGNTSGKKDNKNNNKVKYIDFTYSQIYNNNILGQKFWIKKVVILKDGKWEEKEEFKNKKYIYLSIEKNPTENNYRFMLNSVNDITSEKYDNVLKIPIHIDIQFQLLDTNFASVYTIEGDCIGFEFELKSSLTVLHSLFKDNNILPKNIDNSIINLIKNSHEMINKNKNDIYFLCCVQTIVDKSNQRGAIYKSIAVGTTKMINLHSFEGIAKYLLKESFRIHSLTISSSQKNSSLKSLFSEVYSAFNNINFSFGIGIPQYERGLLSFAAGNEYFAYNNNDNCTNDNKGVYTLKLSKGNVDVDLRLANNQEKIFKGSLLELIQIFKEYTMTIYDAILNEQRIIFVGGSNTSCSKLCRLIFATLSMVGPSGFGFIKRIFPYKNLYDLDFLNIKNCIYGVTNPIFKSKTSDWDVLCEVETGKIAVSSKYEKISSRINKESDKNFIKGLIYRMENEHISDIEIENFFAIYTGHMLKIVKKEYFTENEYLNNEINRHSRRIVQMNESEIRRVDYELDRLRSLLSFNNVSFSMVRSHINNLINRKNIEKEELLIIYSDILNFIRGGEIFCRIFLWSVICQGSDFHFIFNGAFSRNVEIKKITNNIYRILGDDNICGIVVRKMNYFYLLRMSELEVEDE